MRVLIACEESGVMRRAFAALGHDAWSCDLVPARDGSANHIQDDASKATCLWLDRLPRLVPTKLIAPRMVNGKPRWGNQTDSGQNRLSPGPNRARDRSETYPGIAAACAAQWGATERNDQ